MNYEHSKTRSHAADFFKFQLPVPSHGHISPAHTHKLAGMFDFA